MSFDECLQLLAETFPVEETEVRILNTLPHIDSFKFTFGFKIVFVSQNPSVSSSNTMMMSPEQPGLPSASLSPGPLPPPAQRMSPDLEQAWMELLSLPELQV